MSFTSYLPTDRLKPYVRAFIISTTETAGAYKVLPGTSLVMGFQYAGRLAYTAGNTIHSLSNAGITGLMDSYRLFHNSETMGSVLVNFTETGAAAFFKTPLHELFGQSLSLDDLMLRSHLDVTADEIQSAATDQARIAAAERFLLARLNPKAPDDLLNMAVRLIHQSAGTIKITALAEQLNISQSRLEKRFRAGVGASPKKFASLVRIKQLLNAGPTPGNSLQLGLDAGYFDQAHFIKDFRSFTGETPEQFFKKR